MPLALIVMMVLGFWILPRTAGPRGAFLAGWALGAGYFAHALIWITEPFMIEPWRYGWIAPFALVLMAGGMGLFWAAAFWAARALARGSWPLILTWCAAEILRAYLFTGFPWAAPVQGLVDVLAGQGLAWFGPHGLMLLLGALAWAGSIGRAIGIASGVVGLAAVFPFWAPVPVLTDHTVRIVQPNAEQSQKWRAGPATEFFERQLAFTAADAPQQPDLIVWPETAVPWLFDYASPQINEIGTAANGARLVFGMLRNEGFRYYNALVSLGPTGEVADIYDKYHLVPFTEYMPLGEWTRTLGLGGIFSDENYGFARGDGAAVLDFGPLGKGLPLICYEAVFAHDVARAPERADFILHITNDAWFGNFAGPQQHLALARMRAIEQGLPVIRSANTGISAMIGPRGGVMADIPLGTSGYVDAPLAAPLAPTFYARTGDRFIIMLVILALAGAVIRRWRA